MRPVDEQLGVLMQGSVSKKVAPCVFTLGWIRRYQTYTWVTRCRCASYGSFKTWATTSPS
jgi:hypothetical protein